jgi:hypothetical protein
MGLGVLKKREDDLTAKFWSCREIRDALDSRPLGAAVQKGSGVMRFYKWKWPFRDAP